MTRRDIGFEFRPHPLNRDLATKTGSSAIRQSLINLIRTNFGDRGYNIEIGSNIDAVLFENVTLLTTSQIQSNVENTIRNFEPQVSVHAVMVTEGSDGNEIICTITYSELNSTTEQSLKIDLTTVR